MVTTHAMGVLSSYKNRREITMSSQSNNNKRIAKNTLMLYFYDGGIAVHESSHISKPPIQRKVV